MLASLIAHLLGGDRLLARNRLLTSYCLRLLAVACLLACVFLVACLLAFIPTRLFTRLRSVVTHLSLLMLAFVCAFTLLRAWKYECKYRKNLIRLREGKLN